MGSWSRTPWTCIMDVELLKQSWPTKMSKKIPIVGAHTRSVARNSGKLRANGRGTCASRLEKGCREMNYVRPNGQHPKKQHSFCRSHNPYPKRMVRGDWPETTAGPVV